MQTVREAMSTDVTTCSPDASVLDAARAMAHADVGILPVCADGRRLDGVLTDRDITVRVVANAMDPARTSVREVAGDGVVTVGPDDRLDAALALMKRYAVRRVPVIEDERLVGILGQADLAEQAPPDDVGDLVRSISRAPDNSGAGP